MQQQTYLKCNRVGHNDAPIIAVCMDKQCKDIPSCCLICISEHHKDHKNNFVKLDDFNKEVAVVNLKYKELGKKIDTLKKNTLKLLKEIEEVIEQYVDCFTKLIQYNISKQLDLYKEMPNLEELANLANHIKLDHQDCCETLESDTIKVTDSIQTMFQQLQESFQKQIKDNKLKKCKIIETLDTRKPVRTTEPSTIFQSLIRQNQNERYFLNHYQQQFK